MFYKVSEVQAEVIGRFEYSPNEYFDPFINEQTDNTYLISETMYQLLKDTEQFKKIDFSQLVTITIDQLSNKVISNKNGN